MAALLCWLAVPAFGQFGAAVVTCASEVMANLARLLVVCRSIGSFTFGRDIVVITAAGIGLAWCSNLALAQVSVPPFWSAVCGIGIFVSAYAVVSWTHLLSEPEKSGISGALRSRARMLKS